MAMSIDESADSAHAWPTLPCATCAPHRSTRPLDVAAVFEYASDVQVFHNKAEASQDAIRIGRLHCLQDQWSQALVSYMQCGGPVLLQRAVEQKMSSVAQKTLVLWGEQDTILERSNLELVKGSIDDVTVQV
jgi:hypothetical protein